MIKNGEGKTFFKSARFSFSFSSIFHRNTFGREVRFREVETFLLNVLRISFFLVILNFGELSQRNCLSFVLYQILFCRYNRRLKSMLITHATVWVILIPQWGSSSVEGGFQMEIIFKTFRSPFHYLSPLMLLLTSETRFGNYLPLWRNFAKVFGHFSRLS